MHCQHLELGDHDVEVPQLIQGGPPPLMRRIRRVLRLRLDLRARLDLERLPGIIFYTEIFWRHVRIVFILIYNYIKNVPYFLIEWLPSNHPVLYPLNRLRRW